MKLRNTLISIGTAALLIGCGSSSGGKTPLVSETPDKNETVDKKSNVCLDANMNAKCDTGEISEKVVTWNKTDKITTTLTGDVPLAYEGENGYIFTAPAGFGEIYPGTTMQHSERIYNQIITNKTKADAKEYLEGIFGGEISATKKNEVADAIKTAIKANSTANRYDVIAAVMNKVVADISKISSISLSAEDITKASLLSLAKLEISESSEGNVTTKIEAQDKSTDVIWKDSLDASIRNITAKSGKVVGASHYHNALSVMDASTGNIVFTPVGVVTDSGHGKDSVTGASENYLRDIALSSDAKYIYANIPPKKSSSTSNHKETVGFYRADVGADNSIAVEKVEQTINGVKMQTISFDSGSSTRIDKIISSFAVANDDSQVALKDSEGNLFVYKGDLSAEVSASDAIDNIGAMAITKDALYISSDTNITKYKTADLSADGSPIVLDFNIGEIVFSKDGSKLVAFSHGHDNHGVTDIAVINMADQTILNRVSTKASSDTASISPDASRIALVGNGMSEVIVMNLIIDGGSVQGTYKADGVRDVEFMDNDKLAIVSSRNGMSVLDISITTQNNSLDAKIETAKAGLNEASMNGGGLFDAVIKDLALSKSYENVSINWTQSGLSTNIKLPDGNVTRPAVGSADVSGELTANLKATFRGEEKTGTKNFTINVRKTPADLGDAKSVETASIGSQYMAVNADGSITVVPVEYEDAAKKEFYGLISFKLDANGVPVHVTGTKDVPKAYTASESIAGVGISGDYVIGVTLDEADVSKARIFTTALAADATMGDTITNEIALGANPIYRGGVGFSEDKSKIAVMIKDETTEKYTAKIFSVNASGVLTEETAITMDPDAAYSTYGPPVVNNDGTAVYQRTGDSVIKSTAGNPKATEAPVNEVARIFSNNNFIFVPTYEGNIVTLDMDLANEKSFGTGTGGRMYAADANENYLYVPVQRAGDSAYNGIYQLEIGDDGSLTEKAFTNITAGGDRLAVGGGNVYFSLRKKKSMNVIDAE
jgi:hypothetical protein